MVLHRVSIIVFVLVLSLLSQFTMAQFKKVSQQRWQGIASFYHPKFNGRKTSTGETFSNAKLTAANNFLKLGTLVRIMNPKNGKSVVVKINDRMSLKNKRLIDLSQAAAEKIGLIEQGFGEGVMEVFPGETDYISTH